MIDGTTDIVASREEDGRKNEIWWKVEIETSYNCIWCINSIVNPANSVSKLTREQATKSLQEQSKLEGSGWCWRKIVAYSRESSSGTYEFLKMRLWTRKIMQQIFELTCNRCNRSGSGSN
jgi:phosphate transport system substrate-binding protein